MSLEIHRGETIPDPPSKVLDRFVIEKKLAQGPFSKVFYGYDT